MEVETPTVVPSPGLDVHLAAFEVLGGKHARYLSTSPEYQMKRLLAEGAGRIFQIARCYRQDESGDRHNSEFTMLEWYRTSATVEAVMRDTEQLVSAVTGGLVHGGGRKIVTTPPYERLTVCEAFSRHAGISEAQTLAMASHDEEAFFRILVDKVEPKLARYDRPVFLTEYPAPMASLARKKPDDPRVAERFELYVWGVELCNGFGELVDPVEQRARLEEDQRERARRGLAQYPIDEKFLDALSRGIPESAGNALGLDRLVMLIVGASSLAEVMAFSDEDL